MHSSAPLADELRLAANAASPTVTPVNTWRGGRASFAVAIRLLTLTSQGRNDVPQSDAEVVFLGGLKNREIQLVGSCVPSKAAETLHFFHCGTAGHPMPVDRCRRIAGAQRYRDAPIPGRLRRVNGVDAQQQQVAGPHLGILPRGSRSLHGSEIPGGAVHGRRPPLAVAPARAHCRSGARRFGHQQEKADGHSVDSLISLTKTCASAGNYR